MNRYCSLALMCLTLAACDKKEAPADATTPSAAATETPPAPPAVAAKAPAIVDIETLPVEEDFEAEAEKELTVANMSAKLDELDKQISAP